LTAASICLSSFWKHSRLFSSARHLNASERSAAENATVPPIAIIGSTDATAAADDMSEAEAHEAPAEETAGAIVEMHGKAVAATEAPFAMAA